MIKKIENIDKTITIVLEKNEWSSVTTWVESIYSTESNRLSERLCLKTKEWFKINVSIKFLYDMNINFNEKIEIEIPREILRVFIFSVGKIAYNFDVKTQTSLLAYGIVTKIESQLINDEEWVKNRW